MTDIAYRSFRSTLVPGPVLVIGLMGWILMHVAVIGLSGGDLPFDRPTMAGKPFALQLAMPTLGLIEQCAMMGIVWLLTRHRSHMVLRAPAKGRDGVEVVAVLLYAALGQAGGWILGPLLGYRPFSFHLAGSMVGCSVTPTPGETAVWAAYNFVVFAVLPLLWFRYRYTLKELNLVSTDRAGDHVVTLVVLALEGTVQLAAFPAILAMQPSTVARAAPLAFIVFFFGTVLPTMILIFAILLPRYFRLTGSTTLTVILGGLTYAAMHLVEGWSNFSSPRTALLSLIFALVSYVGPGMFKSYVTIRTRNAWVHALGYHAIAPHVIVDTPLIAKIFSVA